MIIYVSYSQSISNSNTIRTGKHCVFNMHAHLVFVTKYRKKVFKKAHLDAMRSIFDSVCDEFESTLVEFNGDVA